MLETTGIWNGYVFSTNHDLECLFYNSDGQLVWSQLFFIIYRNKKLLKFGKKELWPNF